MTLMSWNWERRLFSCLKRSVNSALTTCRSRTWVLMRRICKFSYGNTF
jgi:hypothetical protein